MLKKSIRFESLSKWAATSSCADRVSLDDLSLGFNANPTAATAGPPPEYGLATSHLDSSITKSLGDGDVRGGTCFSSHHHHDLLRSSFHWPCHRARRRSHPPSRHRHHSILARATTIPSRPLLEKEGFFSSQHKSHKFEGERGDWDQRETYIGGHVLTSNEFGRK